MSYSDIVYKSPGAHHGINGKTYDYKAVKSEDAKADALKDGWFDTLAEACGVAEPKEIKEEVGSPSPTRAEMEQKARELGIKRIGNMGDETLAAKIEEALK